MARTYYYYSTTQFIYTAEELGGAKTINSLAFYHNSYSFTSTVKIYLAHTTSSTVDINNPATSGTLVFTGTSMTVGSNNTEWQTFAFNQNFEYNGTDNLLVVICRDDNSGYNSYQTWQYTATTDNKFMYRNADQSDYGDITNTSNSYTASTNRPNVIIGYVPTAPYVTLDPISATVMTGFTQTLTATVGNVSGTPTINYSSSDQSVAKVEGSGTTATVTGMAPGTATITATMNYQGTDYTATCAITVEEPSYCSPTFSNPSDDYIKNFTTTGGVTNISNSSTYETGGYSDYYGTLSASIEAGETLSCTVTPSSTSYSYGHSIWVDWNKNYEFESDERVAYSTSVATGNWTGEIEVPATTAQGDYRMRVIHLFYYNVTNPCHSASYGEGEDYKLTVLLASCSKPSNLAVSEIGKRSAKLSWTENGEATAWQICLNGDEDHLIDANANPYTLTGLDPETDYTVKVRANCSSEPSNWTDEISFTTEVACPAPTIGTIDVAPRSATVNWTGSAEDYTLEYALVPAAKDPYSNDGWYYYDNGSYGTNYGLDGGEFRWGIMFPAGSFEGDLLSAVKAFDTAPMAGTLAIYNDGTTAPANQLSIQDIEFTGAGAWVEFSTNVVVDPTKNVWVIFDNVSGTDYPASASNDDNGDANGRWIELSGNWYDLSDAGLPGKTNMIRAYFEESIDPSTLRWTTVNNVTSPYTINDLLPETKYAVRVKAECGGSDGESVWDMKVFTTPSECEAPYNLEANVMHTSATLSWEGYQEEYNLQYRTAAYRDIILEQDFENGLGDWQVVNNHTANTAEINGTNFRSGAYSFRFQSWNNSGDGYDQYLISPMLNKSAIFSFYYRAHGGNYGPDSFIIGYSTTGNDVENDFTWDNATATSTSTTNWTEFQYAIPSETKYIAIQYTSNYNEYLYIDDIQILGEEHPEGEWVTRNNVTSPQEVTDLTINTKYDWQVQGNCSEANSHWTASTFNTLRDDEKVFLTDGNWCDETNWEGGIPTAGDQAYIYAAATIPAGCEATVSAITMYDGGSITIQDGGELTHKSPGTMVTIEKNIIGYTGETDRYYLISAAGTINSTDVTNLLTGNYDYYSFDGAQENEEWRNYKTATFNMANGMGYLYANDDDVTLIFTNPLMDRNTYYYCGGSASSYLTYDESKPWGTFNLVGNTYTCKGYLYLYSSSITPITDFYVMNQEGTEIVSSENEYLLPNQGAFVQSTASNQFALISGIAPSRTASNEVLNMTVKGSTNSDVVRIRFAEGRGLEKFQINPSHTKLYIPQDGNDYAVVYSKENVGEMPVNFKAESNGTYTLGFNTENVEFSYLHLIDNMTGADVDLLANPSYSFSAQTTDYASRFRLVFATGSSASSDTFGFINGMGNLCIFGIEGEATVQVMDALGHIISSNQFSGSYDRKLNVAPGVYMIRLIQGNDVKVQKMVIR